MRNYRRGKSAYCSGVWSIAILSMLWMAACDRLPSADRESQSSNTLAEMAKAKKKQPDPVERKNGMSYIPIDGKVFLMPDETWLKGVARNSNDGMVSRIALHATVPDVQPWSKERHEEMYQPAGPGKKLEIYIRGDRKDQVDRFYRIPQSILGDVEFIEESSDQDVQGLRRFRQSWGPYTEGDARDGLNKFGPQHVENRKKNSNKPMMDMVYYELTEHGRVRYFISCSDSKDAIFQGCHLFFPWGESLMVDVYFMRDHIGTIVAMADKVSEQLRKFEEAGMAYRVVQSRSAASSPRQ